MAVYVGQRRRAALAW